MAFIWWSHFWISSRDRLKSYSTTLLLLREHPHRFDELSLLPSVLGYGNWELGSSYKVWNTHWLIGCEQVTQSEIDWWGSKSSDISSHGWIVLSCFPQSLYNTWGKFYFPRTHTWMILHPDSVNIWSVNLPSFFHTRHCCIIHMPLKKNENKNTNSRLATFRDMFTDQWLRLLKKYRGWNFFSQFMWGFEWISHMCICRDIADISVYLSIIVIFIKKRKQPNSCQCSLMRTCYCSTAKNIEIFSVYVVSWRVFHICRYF